MSLLLVLVTIHNTIVLKRSISRSCISFWPSKIIGRLIQCGSHWTWRSENIWKNTLRLIKSLVTFLFKPESKGKADVSLDLLTDYRNSQIHMHHINVTVRLVSAGEASDLCKWSSEICIQPLKIHSRLSAMWARAENVKFNLWVLTNQDFGVGCDRKAVYK